jgi:hypothetical protein
MVTDLITVVARDIYKQDTSRVCVCVTREKHVSACTVEPWKKVSLYMYCKSVIGDRTVQPSLDILEECISEVNLNVR